LAKRSIVQVAVVGLLIGLVAAAAPAQGAGEPGVVHFTAAGDFGQNATTSAVLTAMHAADPDLALTVGDFSYGDPGTEPSWCDFVTERMGAGFPFELLTGNHESDGTNGNVNDFAACLPNQLPGLVGTYGRQWYVDVPRVNPLVRFVMVSPGIPFASGTTTSYAAGTPAYTWTAAAIDGARSRSIPWVVVGMHVPCWSQGAYSCTAVDPDLRTLLLTKHVDLVLNGHEHFYQRSKQLAQGRTGCTTIPIDSYDADCVADADSDLVAGAGTVWTTVGTGGQPLRDLNTSDPEGPYFAASSAQNVNGSHGFLDVSLTADDLSARFVRVDGSFSDAFTIRRGAAPANQPPTASFTSSASGLTASVDARSSGDADGTITAWSWDFGDGTTGTGPTATHTYGAAGTYTVTLRVTDDGGAAGTAAKQVTVTAPTPPPTGTGDFVTDTFSRTVSNGLGAADLGGPWTVGGSASNFSVASGTGALRLATAATQVSAYLGATTRTATDLRMTVTLDKITTGNGVYLDVTGRRVSAGNEYQANLILQPGGRLQVGLTAVRSSTEVALQPLTQLAGVTYAAGSPLAIRLQVSGTAPTTVRVKVWPAGSPEPAAWQATATDSTAALQAAGSVGVAAYLSSSATNAPVTVRLDDLSARPPA
jgi:PKD repeat protein